MSDNDNLWGLPQPAPIPCNFCGVSGIAGEDIKYVGTLIDPITDVHICRGCAKEWKLRTEFIIYGGDR
jgi:hypothetical protein